MKLMRRLPIIIALVLPSAVFAEDPPRTDDDERADVDVEVDVDEGTRTARAGEGGKTSEKTEKTEKAVTAKHSSDVEEHVIPAVAGIESADKAAAVLYELAGNGGLAHKHAQMAVDLAKQAVAMALERTTALDNVKDLPADSKAEADRAVTKLREARMTLRKIDKQVSKKSARISATMSEQIRDQARDVHDDLSEAENAIDQIAKAHDVETDLEFRG